MKNTFIITTLTALAASQGIGDLPTCSLTCLTTAISGLGCGLTDFACSCQKASELTPVVTPCVQSSCSDPADQAKTIETLAGICAAAGFPIEVPEAPASSSTVDDEPTPTPTASSSAETPVETSSSAPEEPEYSAYPTATDAHSEYPAPTHATDDVPNLPSSSYSNLIPLPSFVDSSVMSLPSPQPTSLPSALPPYPSTSHAPSLSAPQGTGAPSHTSSSLPEFTGAAVAARAPVVAAGLFGLAAFVL